MYVALFFVAIIGLILISGFTGQLLARIKFIKTFNPIFGGFTLLVIALLFLFPLGKWYWYILAIIVWLVMIVFLNAGFSAKRDDKKEYKPMSDKDIDLITNASNHIIDEGAQDAGDRLGSWLND